MSKSKRKRFLVKLASSEGSGYFKVKERNPKQEKLSFRKYDPKLRKHVLFKEEKLK
ncbi:50S ribosomal protein L33 [Candidatus Phycorickettsia trachydisci]|uniref:Large ribosomal subunit protein bL33 n=1 Tax=Candidatus Phycorickettsia trachydisci TaxID=2115978 RepID=A0A2P1P868_9RICK|nr:50S ribosomal protein L33 [Candidatus Phycorickettsia trachydisci]AVP87462.1 50S ribosomal protein L33 [Candidatus Phycorickettsia trachydisci]